MLVVRGTKKLRDRVRGPVAGDDDVSTGVLGDWFGTALFWKPPVALVVNARTFLPVFVPLAPAGKLLDRLPDEIARILTLHGVDPAVVEAEQEAMSEVRIAPTNDRRVVGVMNEFAFLGEHWFEGDLTTLSLRMAGAPVGPLRSGDRFPDRALAALVGDLSPRADGSAEVIPFPGMDLPAATSPVPAKATGLTSRVTEGEDPPSGAPSVFQLKVTLLNTKPPIWRRVLVDSSITLGDLHDVIQAAFGWWNCHLHEFEIGRTRYGIPDPDWDFAPATGDERAVRLDSVAAAGSSFHYTYDFGDDWRHKVTVEKVGPVEPGTAVPDCIGGRRGGTPEDCGGPWGYQGILESLGGRPGASDARLDFVGPSFDPATFDPGDFALNLANVRNTSFDI
ncbi:hypothetical protein BH23ACT2_BH23ACT2_07190 [soil metagenome]